MGALAAPLVAALVEVSVAHGAPAAALLDVLQVRQADLADPDRRVPVEHVFAAWELAVSLTGDDALPIAVGRLASVQRFGMLGYAVYTSATVRHAIAALSRYHRLINDSGLWSFAPTEHGGIVTWSRPGPSAPGRALANEQALASFVQLGREIVDRPLAIREVWLERAAPREDTAHRAHFGDVIHWSSPAAAVHLSTSTLDAPPRGADPLLVSFFAERADAAVLAIAKRDSWKARTARMVTEQLPAGIPTAAAIASSLDVSERTLRRRLSDEGAQFADLVSEVQRARAGDLLSAGTAVRDVAFATGFADPTAFSRAYRRWTGSAPSSAKKAPRS